MAGGDAKVFIRFGNAQFHLLTIQGCKKGAVFIRHQHCPVSTNDADQVLAEVWTAPFSMKSVPLLAGDFRQRKKVDKR
jgi:hypothetical protein